MNMMRKNTGNKNNYSKNRQGGGSGGRRYHNNSGGGQGGNRGGNDAGNIARQKHHATQMREKYSNMARDAQNNGDRVDVEYYLQHVDHYTRVLSDIAAIEAERYAHQREQQIVPGGPNDPNATPEQIQAHQAQESKDAAEAASAPADDQQQQSEAPVQQSNQPRMTRQPRRQQSDNGAREANSNTTEIPLPDSILPPI